MQKFKQWCKQTWARIPNDRLYKKWKRIPRSVRAPLVLIFGSTIVITGIAMLVLPGPGWAAIFLGIAILASEFAIVEKVRDWLILQAKRWLHHAKKRWQDRKNTPQA